MSAAWTNNQPNTVTRQEAINKIMAMANEQNLKGAFKVFYKDEIIADPSELPEQVDMSAVKVSAVLDQA